MVARMYSLGFFLEKKDEINKLNLIKCIYYLSSSNYFQNTFNRRYNRLSSATLASICFSIIIVNSFYLSFCNLCLKQVVYIDCLCGIISISYKIQQVIYLFEIYAIRKMCIKKCACSFSSNCVLFCSYFFQFQVQKIMTKFKNIYIYIF